MKLPPMVTPETGGRLSPTAVRLRLLRVALFNENTTAFARRLDISLQRLSNMERGVPLSLDVAKKIRRSVPGMTVDWLYFADERALPLEMVSLLRETAKALPEQEQQALRRDV